MLYPPASEGTTIERNTKKMTMAGKQVNKKGSGGRHGAANTGVSKKSVKGRSKGLPTGKTNSTGGGPGGGF